MDHQFIIIIIINNEKKRRSMVGQEEEYDEDKHMKIQINGVGLWVAVFGTLFLAGLICGVLVGWPLVLDLLHHRHSVTSADIKRFKIYGSLALAAFLCGLLGLGMLIPDICRLNTCYRRLNTRMPAQQPPPPPPIPEIVIHPS